MQKKISTFEKSSIGLIGTDSMYISSLASSRLNKQREKIQQLILFFSLFLLYLLLRGFAWKTNNLFQDSDSIAYLGQIKILLSLDAHKIMNLSPGFTPIYPLFGAICTLPGWSLEIGARLCSFLFSTLLFVAILGIGKHLADNISMAMGLLILALSPPLVYLSFKVHSEPSYITLVYLGFWFFLTQYKEFRSWKATVLGIIFGLAFLTRTEGILYLFLIPLLQGIYSLFVRHNIFTPKRFFTWVSLYLLGFLMIASPQILRVSHKMGRFAINSRVAWMEILCNPDGKSYEEKIYGLDFSPSQVNKVYILSHPEVVKQFHLYDNSEYYLKTFKHIAFNLHILYDEELGDLIGPVGFGFFLCGLLAFFQSGRQFESLILVSFIASSLLAPVLSPIYLDHIAIIAPIIMLIEGIGIVWIFQLVSEMQEGRFFEKLVVVFLILFHLLIGTAYPTIKKLYKPSTFNWGYSPDELKKPTVIVREIVANERLHSPKILEKYPYLTFHSESVASPLPYTNYSGLVRYCQLNDVNFLFLQHRFLSEYPFLDVFLKSEAPPDFKLLHRALDHWGHPVELYRFKERTPS